MNNDKRIQIGLKQGNNEKKQLASRNAIFIMYFSLNYYSHTFSNHVSLQIQLHSLLLLLLYKTKKGE